MKPKYRNGELIKESTLFDDDELLNVDSKDLVKEDDEPQDKPVESEEAPGAMDEQTLRVECLKIAVKIAKLFDEVQPSDLIEMSDQVFKYVQNQDMVSGEWDPTYGLGDEETPAEDENPTEEEPAAEEEPEVDDFELDDLELPDEEEKNNPEEEEEEKEKEDEVTGEIPDDFFEFTV